MGFVPAWQVFSFNIIKKPFFSALWYSLLVYTIWDPRDTLPTVFGIVFLVLSFTGLRFYMGIFSILPCVATMILAQYNLVRPYSLIVLIAGIVWIVIYIIAMYVWRQNYTGRYKISETSNVMYKEY